MGKFKFTETEIKGKLTKYIEKEDGIELYFKITNNIEYLVDLRQIDVEIIWWSTGGLVVENEALTKIKDNDVKYINAIKYSEIVSIPVKVVKQNDKYSVITNYTNEELNELNIKNSYKIKLHDRIIVKDEEEV